MSLLLYSERISEVKCVGCLALSNLNCSPKQYTHIIYSITRIHTSYLSFFLHIPNLWLNFSPRKSAENQDKTDFARKQRKSRQNYFSTKKHDMYICKDILHIIHMPDVETLQISPHLSCGEI